MIPPYNRLNQIFSLTFADSGRIYVFGDGRSGQLGVRLPQETSYLTIPSAVSIPFAGQILQVDCGAMHTAAVSGTLLCHSYT